MKTPNTIEDEIDRIRLEIYEETKDMTPAQRTERLRRNVDEFYKEMGYKKVPFGIGYRIVKIKPGETPS